MEHDLAEVLLRESRPQARPGFQDELEQQLFPPRRTARGLPRIPRPALVGAASAAAMATVILGLSLAGSGPLAGSDSGVEATSDCKTVTVTKRERLPYIARSASAEPKIAYRIVTRQRQVKRCP